MRAHRSLQQKDVIRYGPAKIALMVASEFWRASSGADYQSDVQACYDRARELMGILETLSIQETVAADLQPLYKECIWSEMVQEVCLSPDHVREFSTRLAEKFEQAAGQLSSESHA